MREVLSRIQPTLLERATSFAQKTQELRLKKKGTSKEEKQYEKEERTHSWRGGFGKEITDARNETRD